MMTRVTLYETYEARCQREGLVDFAELMLRCASSFEGKSACARALQRSP